MEAADAVVDLPAYLRRVGYRGELAPSYAVLQGLHLAHAIRIPFENIDARLGRPIRLDLESLQRKLVTDRRGGYCFEQNLLFAAVLRRIGFPVRQLAARVRLRTTRLLPRTHMLLLVTADGRDWLADVGFGGEGLLMPVPFGGAETVRHFAWTYRIVAEGEQWVLQSRRGEGWLELYAFTLEPQHLVDYEMANYYVSTHPDSRFVQTLTAQLPTPEARYLLIDRELMIDRGDTATTRSLAEGEVADVLASTFRLRLPPGLTLPPAR
jgi:N-hydroxyarylamine O-acetyltransferase